MIRCRFCYSPFLGIIWMKGKTFLLCRNLCCWPQPAQPLPRVLVSRMTDLSADMGDGDVRAECGALSERWSGKDLQVERDRWPYWSPRGQKEGYVLTRLYDVCPVVAPKRKKALFTCDKKMKLIA